MSRQLLILRHGKSDWDTDSASDFDRPLAARGKRDAPRMGEFLVQHALVPEYIISSPAQRAKQTAEAICEVLGRPVSDIHWEPGVYEAGLGTLMTILQRVPARIASVLLVGHNPGLASLFMYVCGDRVPIPPDGKLLATATLARVSVTTTWKGLDKGTGTSLGVTRPRDLPPVK